ncbi:MAG: hypothetical protein QG614_460 [Patescibacteria group bacterium]|nr:hypothetical protein [Patescibacteria group bacterium]
MDMKENKKILKFISNNILRILLIIVLGVFILYIFSEDFRCYLLRLNIDFNFIIGIFTILALILSLIQSSYDKRFNYNMVLISSLEEKGLSIISKLLTLKQKSETILINLKEHKKAIVNKSIYKDNNESISRKNVEDGIELISSYVDVYFPEENLNWNNLIDKISKIATYNLKIVLNYEAYFELIQNGTEFENESLDSIDIYISETEKIKKEICNLTLEMRNRIVVKMNKNKEKVKSGFNFRV